MFEVDVPPPNVIDDASFPPDVGRKCEQCVVRFAAEQGCLNHAFELPKRKQQSHSVPLNFKVVGYSIFFDGWFDGEEINEVGVIPSKLRHQSQVEFIRALI